MKRIFIALMLVLVASAAWAWSAKVVGVSDGDTITVLRSGNEQVKIRLYGIDAPESGQPFGKASKAMLSALVFGKTVEIEPTVTDKYGRTVARVIVDGVDANAEQIRTGNAWLYRQYCDGPMCQEWATLESTAKASRGGLWADNAPTPPWEWRKGGQQAASKDVQAQLVASVGPYSGNVKSGVFHRAGCRHYNCKNCVENFSSREAAIAAGYRPCGICKP